jgi:hypothetical protein
VIAPAGIAPSTSTAASSATGAMSLRKMVLPG